MKKISTRPSTFSRAISNIFFSIQRNSQINCLPIATKVISLVYMQHTKHQREKGCLYMRLLQEIHILGLRSDVYAVKSNKAETIAYPDTLKG